MQRRELMTLLGSAAITWPHAARGQTGAKVPRLGVLLYGNPQADPSIEALRRSLRALGYVEGKSIGIEYRAAEGKPERLPDLALDLVRSKPDVLMALGGDVAPPAVRATKTIPIVFATSADPVEGGLVGSLARPGGNATGVTFLLDETASKRMELLKEAVPRLTRVAFLYNPDHPDNEEREARRAATALGVQLHVIDMRGPGDLDGAFRAIKQAGADALYVVSSRQTALHSKQIVDFATNNRLPLAGGWGAWAQAGGLLSYGPNLDELTRISVTYVDRILKGARPEDLPVQRPVRFELLVNLKTAKTFGLDIPESFLLRADKVIE